MVLRIAQRSSQAAIASKQLLPAVLVAALVLLLHVDPAVDAKADVYIEDADRFPGWKGELPQQQPLEKATNDATVGYGDKEEEWRGVVEQISWTPRAFKYHKLLSDEECAHLINGVKSRMAKSTVVDNKTGKSIDSSVRTSTGSFYGRGSDDVIRRIERRLSHITFLPEDNGEGLQILHYVNGQEYKPHHDFFNDEVNARPENGGQRIATVLMYLTTPEEGGETIFPKAHTKTNLTSGVSWSDCARNSGGLAVKPRKGDALMFYSLKANGETDQASLHGSCPTLKGDKWSATKWIHVSGFGISSEAQRAKWGECIDADDRCEEWAAAGECNANKPYMLKYCRPACKVCDPDNPKGGNSKKVEVKPLKGKTAQA